MADLLAQQDVFMEETKIPIDPIDTSQCPATPLAKLMRNCAETPRIALETSERDANLPSARRTGPRSSRRAGLAKLVAFDLPVLPLLPTIMDAPTSTKRKARRHRRGDSPAKALFGLDENARPDTASSLGSDNLKTSNTHNESSFELRASVQKQRALEAQVRALTEMTTNMQRTIEEKENRILQLTSLASFLTTEVQIYTKCLEDEVKSQKEVIRELQISRDARD